MSGSVQAIELRNTWESAAPGWAKWETKFSARLDDVTDTLLDMASVRRRVIDLACGAGSQSLRAAFSPRRRGDRANHCDGALHSLGCMSPLLEPGAGVASRSRTLMRDSFFFLASASPK
jgi:hypothetical protein